MPTWITPLVLILFTSILIPNTSFLGHICAVIVGYLCMSPHRTLKRDSLTRTDGLGYIKFLNPPEKVLRWIEGKLNLLGRLPHYVSVDQKTYGRYGVLPQAETGGPSAHSVPIGMSWLGNGSSASGGQRLGP